MFKSVLSLIKFARKDFFQHSLIKYHQKELGKLAPRLFHKNIAFWYNL